MNVFIPSASWAPSESHESQFIEASLFSYKYSTNGELKAGKPREISIKPVAIKNNHMQEQKHQEVVITVPIPNSLIHRSCTCHFLIYQSTLYVMSLFLALVVIECFMLIKRTSHTLRCMH
jgi:hypothetical protein